MTLETPRFYRPQIRRLLFVVGVTVSLLIALVPLVAFLTVAWTGLLTTTESLSWLACAALALGTVSSHAKLLRGVTSQQGPWAPFAWVACLMAFLAMSAATWLWIALLLPILVVDASAWASRCRSASVSIVVAPNRFAELVRSAGRFLRGDAPSINIALHRALGYDVFIAYRAGLEPHGCGDIPLALQAALRAKGHSAFLDHLEVGPGDPIRASIDSALGTSRCLVLLMSDDAVKSQWMLREASVFGQKSNSPLIVPIFLTPAALQNAKTSAPWQFLFSPEVERSHVDVVMPLPAQLGRVAAAANKISLALGARQARALGALIGKIAIAAIAALACISIALGGLYSVRADVARRQAVSGLILAGISSGELSDAVALADEAKEQMFSLPLETPIEAAFARVPHPMSTMHLGAAVTAMKVTSMSFHIATEDGRLHQLDLDDGHTFRRETASGKKVDPVTAIEFEVDGSEPFFLGHRSGALTLRDNKKVVGNPHRSSIAWIFVNTKTVGVYNAYVIAALITIDESGLVAKWSCDDSKWICEGRPLLQLESRPTSADASLLGKHILLGDEAGFVYRIDVSGSEPVRTVRLGKRPVVKVALGGDPFSDDLKFFAVNSAGDVMIARFSDPVPGQLVYASDKSSQVIAAAFEEDYGNRFALGMLNGSVLLFGTDGSEQDRLKFEAGDVRRLVMAKSASSMLVVHASGAVRHWIFGNIKLSSFQASTVAIKQLAWSRGNEGYFLTIDEQNIARSWGIKRAPLRRDELSKVHGWRISKPTCTNAQVLLPVSPLRCAEHLRRCDSDGIPVTDGRESSAAGALLLIACQRRSAIGYMLPFAKFKNQ